MAVRILDNLGRLNSQRRNSAVPKEAVHDLRGLTCNDMQFKSRVLMGIHPLIDERDPPPDWLWYSHRLVCLKLNLAKIP